MPQKNPSIFNVDQGLFAMTIGMILLFRFFAWIL